MIFIDKKLFKKKNNFLIFGFISLILIINLGFISADLETSFTCGGDKETTFNCFGDLEYSPGVIKLLQELTRSSGQGINYLDEGLIGLGFEEEPSGGGKVSEIVKIIKDAFGKGDNKDLKIGLIMFSLFIILVVFIILDIIRKRKKITKRFEFWFLLVSTLIIISIIALSYVLF